MTISHHNMPCKNKLGVLYFVVASFTWLLRASSKNCSYLRIKTTTTFHQVWCFNLQQGSAVVKLDSTKVGETDTRQPPMCKARRYNQSHEHCHVMSVRCASSNNTAESKKDVGGKQYDYYRPQLFVFYSCISSTHRPDSDTTAGERNISKKLPMITQDLSRRCIATRREECVHVPS